MIPMNKLVVSVNIRYNSQLNRFYNVNFKVLCGPPACLSWVDASGGDIPENAVPGGQEEDGEIMYIGRAIISGTVTVGKVHPSHGSCYVPYGKSSIILLTICFVIFNSLIDYFYE